MQSSQERGAHPGYGVVSDVDTEPVVEVLVGF